MARSVQIGGLRSSDEGRSASTRVIRNPRPRRYGPRHVAIAVGCLAFIGAAAAGIWAYPRYFGGNKTCLLPAPAAPGPAVTIGSQDEPMTVVYGQLAILEQATNPVRFKVIPSDVEIRDVHFAGQVFPPMVIPERGSLRIIKVAGKSFALRGNDIESGCVNLRGLGKAILLFTNSLSPRFTLVLTPDQMKWFQ